MARLMAELPEIGTVSNKAIANLAGVAPLASQRGNHDRPRRTRGGRERPRSFLFIAAGLAARHEPDICDFGKRLMPLANSSGPSERPAGSRGSPPCPGEMGVPQDRWRRERISNSEFANGISA